MKLKGSFFFLLVVFKIVAGMSNASTSTATTATTATAAAAAAAAPAAGSGNSSPSTPTTSTSSAQMGGPQCCASNYGAVPTSPPTSSCSGSFSWTSCTQTCYNIKCCGTSSLGTGCAYYGHCSSESATQEGTNYNVLSAIFGATGVTCTATTGITATMTASGIITNVMGAGSVVVPNRVIATFCVLILIKASFAT